MTNTIEFLYYLVCVGMLIAGLRLAENPWADCLLLIGWPILILVSVWFIGSYLPTLLTGRSDARSRSASSW